MSQKNQLLADALRELGWSITRIAAEVNSFMGQVYVSRSAVSEWLNRGRVPHDPLPTVVAHVISIALGRDLKVAELWQNKAKISPLWVPANADLSVRWDVNSTVAVLDDWLRNGGKMMNLDRRTFLAISGTALTLPAWGYVESLEDNSLISWNSLTKKGVMITPGVANVLERTISGLREMDDLEGGARENLKFLHHHFISVADYLKNGTFSDNQTRQRLFAGWAELSQVGSWMAYDSEDHGLAQRYFTSGLHAARSADSRDLGSHLLASMAYQTVYSGRSYDAIELSNAAKEAAQGTSVTMRALVNSRFGLTQAAVGNTHGFRAALDEAYGLLDRSDANVDRPNCLYWFDKEELSSQAGHGLLALAFSTSRNPMSLIEEAEVLIAPKALPANTSSPRDGVFHSAWLARSYLRRGEMEKALVACRHALSKLNEVRSERPVSLIRKFEQELNSKKDLAKKSDVRDFHEELRLALAR